MSQPGVSIDLDIGDDIAELTRGLSRSNAAVSKAITRALRKTMTRLASHGKRRLLGEMGLSKGAVDDRFRTRLNIKGGYASLWLGLLPLEAQKIADPIQGPGGVIAGQYGFEHAFVAKVYDSTDKVWLRKFRGVGSTAKGRAALGASGKRWSKKGALGGGNYSKGNPAGRFPLEKMTIDIADKGSKVMKQMQSEIRVWFRKILEQELNYAVLHEKK